MFIPCSHVGHVFRKKFPYNLYVNDTIEVITRNKIRLAEVWLDDYKQFFYKRYSDTSLDHGDVTDQHSLRKSLQCQSFDWYIKNVIPDQFLPNKTVHQGLVNTHLLYFERNFL